MDKLFILLYLTPPQAPLADKAAHVEGILAVDSWSEWWCVAFGLFVF